MTIGPPEKKLSFFRKKWYNHTDRVVEDTAGGEIMPGFTKNAIKKEFLRLLDEKPLNQITVKIIVERGGINRNSFYYHYQDLPALIEEIVREQADIFIADYPDIGSMEEAINAVVDFCSRNRRAILHIYKSVNRDIFEDYLWKICDYVLSAYAKTAFKGHRVSESDRRLILDYYGFQCFGICISWLNKGMKEDVREKIARFHELEKGFVEEMIRRAEET